MLPIGDFLITHRRVSPPAAPALSGTPNPCRRPGDPSTKTRILAATPQLPAKNNPDPDAHQVDGLSRLGGPQVMAEFQAQADPPPDPVIQPATVVEGYCSASSEKERDSAVNKGVDLAPRSPRNEVVGGSHRSQTRRDSVSIGHRLEDAQLAAQSEPVREPTFRASTHMNKVTVPAGEGAPRYHDRPREPDEPVAKRAMRRSLLASSSV